MASSATMICSDFVEFSPCFKLLLLLLLCGEHCASFIIEDFAFWYSADERIRLYFLPSIQHLLSPPCFRTRFCEFPVSDVSFLKIRRPNHIFSEIVGQKFDCQVMCSDFRLKSKKDPFINQPLKNTVFQCLW